MIEMTTNFTFSNNVGIDFNNMHFDLHSFFSIANISLNPLCGNVVIEFRTEIEFLDKVHFANKLTLEFSEINYIELSPLFCLNYSNSLEEYGFKSSDDYDYNWLKNISQAERFDHIIFRFSSLEHLRIASRKCTCQVDFLK